MKPSQAGLVLTVLILIFCAISLISIRSVEPRSAEAPAEDFSVERAWTHIEAIARKPHPTGSLENERVRNYLAGQLEAMGLEPDLQSTTALSNWGDDVIGGKIHNVAARFLGSERGKAVLLMAHHDSVQTGPGAADDGSGVVALLETLRALKAGEPLRNDVIILLTDAEEAGLLGAKAFFEQHPWAKDVGMVLNFEARGHYGPSLMFESSDGNGPLIREFAKVNAHKLSYSYGYEVYRRMPNDTDFTMARRAGLPGLNFAFIHGLNRYHSQLDDIERLDRGSVQHHGEFALELARIFGNADLDQDWQSGQNAIYFHLIGPIFIHYPGALAMPLAILLLIGAVVCMRRGMVHGRVSLGRALMSMVVLLLIGVLLGVAFMVLAGQLISPFFSYSLSNGWNSTSLSLLAISLLWSATAVVAFGWVRGRLGDSLLAGGLLLWSLLTLAMTLVAPGASYLFGIPLLAGILTGFVWFGRGPEEESISMGQLLVLAVSGILIALIWAPTYAFIGVALGPPTALLVGLFGTAALWGLMAPHLELLGRWRRLYAILSLVFAVGLAFWVQTQSKYDEVNRRPNSILYTMDTETGKASWISFDRAVDDFTQQFLGENPERAEIPAYLSNWRRRPQFVVDAPVASLSPASVVPLGERQKEDGGYVLDFQIGWPFHAEDALIYLRTEGQVEALKINGESAILPERTESEVTDTPIRIRFFGASEGVQLSVELAGSEPLEIETVGRDHSLPELEGFSPRPRAKDMMPQPGRLVDTTTVRGVITLVPGSVMPAEDEEAEEAEAVATAA